jgi:hypothetical protein
MPFNGPVNILRFPSADHETTAATRSGAGPMIMNGATPLQSIQHGGGGSEGSGDRGLGCGILGDGGRGVGDRRVGEGADPLFRALDAGVDAAVLP